MASRLQVHAGGACGVAIITAYAKEGSGRCRATDIPIIKKKRTHTHDVYASKYQTTYFIIVHDVCARSYEGVADHPRDEDQPFQKYISSDVHRTASNASRGRWRHSAHEAADDDRKPWKPYLVDVRALSVHCATLPLSRVHVAVGVCHLPHPGSLSVEVAPLVRCVWL